MMMKGKYLLATSLFTIICSLSYAQSTQIGFVKEYNEKLVKTPLGQVEIVISNASSTVSDANGIFQLQFRTLKPGDKVNVRRIEKNGYEVFNKEALEQWYISRNNSPFTIVMCRSDRFKRIRDAYSRVSSESYEKALKKEETRLDAERKAGKLKQDEYETALKKLNEEYDRQLEDLDNYVDRFARIDLSELSAAEAEIIELVQHGDIDEAIRRYEQQHLEDRYKEQVLVSSKAQAAIDTLAMVKNQALMSRDSLFASILRKNEMLRLAGGRDNFEKIGQSLKTTALNDISYYPAVWECAEYSFDQNVFDEALRFYGICSTLTKDPAKLIQIHSRLGSLQLKQNHFNESERSFLKALEYSEILWAADSTYYRSLLAESQDNLAHLYARMRNFRKAEAFFYESQKHFKILCAEQPDYLENLAISQIDLSEMLLDMRKFHLVEIVLNQAEENVNSLSRLRPDKFASLMASVEFSKGRNHRYYMRYHEAETSYMKSLDYYSALYNKNPGAYRPQLARVYDRLSDLYTLKQEFQQAEETVGKALSLYDTLTILSTDAYRPNIANFKNEQANLCRLARQYTELEQYALEGFELTKQLYAIYPDVYRFDLCNVTTNMGISAAMHNDMRIGEVYFLESKNLADTLIKEYPDVYLPTYYNTVRNLGSLYSTLHQNDKDSLYTKEAMRVCSILYESAPSVYKGEMSQMLYNYAVCCNKMKDFAQADSIARFAETITSELVEDYPDMFMDDYRKIIKIIGVIQGNLNNKEDEINYALKALDKARSLYKKAPKVYMYDYVDSLEDVALFYLEEGDMEKARAFFNEGSEKIRQLYEEYPDVYAPKTGEFQLIVALYYKMIQEPEQALLAQNEATRIYEKLYATEPMRHSFELGLCYTQTAILAYNDFHDDVQAEYYYLKSLPLYYAVLGSDPVNKNQIISNRRSLFDIYRKRNDSQKALEQINAILELEPENEEYMTLKKDLNGE